jgi:hypothetical protein
MKDGHIRVVVVVIENGLNYLIFKFLKKLDVFSAVETLIAKEEHNAERTFNEGKNNFFRFIKIILPFRFR